MVRLTMTPAIVRALQCAQDSAQLLAQGDNSADLSSLKASSGEPITHEQIIELSKALKKFKENSKNGRREDYPPYSLEKLLRGSRVYIEPAEPKAEPVSPISIMTICQLMAHRHRNTKL